MVRSHLFFTSSYHYLCFDLPRFLVVVGKGTGKEKNKTRHREKLNNYRQDNTQQKALQIQKQINIILSLMYNKRKDRVGKSSSTLALNYCYRKSENFRNNNFHVKIFSSPDSSTNLFIQQNFL